MDPLGYSSGLISLGSARQVSGIEGFELGNLGSKLLVFPLVTPIVVPYIIPYKTPFRSLDYGSWAQQAVEAKKSQRLPWASESSLARHPTRRFLLTFRDKSGSY